MPEGLNIHQTPIFCHTLPLMALCNFLYMSVYATGLFNVKHKNMEVGYISEYTTYLHAIVLNSPSETISSTYIS
jgi:hypothetical protein